MAAKTDDHYQSILIFRGVLVYFDLEIFCSTWRWDCVKSSIGGRKQGDWTRLGQEKKVVINGIVQLGAEYLGQELDKVGGLDQGDESCELGVEGEQVKDGTRLA